MFISAHLSTSAVCSASLLGHPSQGQVLSLVFIFWHVGPIAEGPVWLLLQQIFTSRAADIQLLKFLHVDYQPTYRNRDFLFSSRRYRQNYINVIHTYWVLDCILRHMLLSSNYSLILIPTTIGRDHLVAWCFASSQLFKTADLKMDCSSTQIPFNPIFQTFGYFCTALRDCWE